MKNLLSVCFALVAWVAGPGSVARGAAECAAIFSSHMVLQRDQPVPVWGRAAAGENVIVEFAGQRVETTADAAGGWRIKLAPLAVSTEARALVVRGANVVTFDDVLVGEVWLCSGQSNMEKPIGEQRGQLPTDNASEELRAANHPLLRLYQMARNGRPQAGDYTMRWLPCTPEHVERMRFSAAGYFFGRELRARLDVPVGLIHTSVGGTRIELWTPTEGFAAVPALRDYAEAAAGGRRIDGTLIGGLHRSMVAPLVPFALRGFLWYQGESNLINGDAAIYVDKMRALAAGWRAVWGQADLPLYYVQLAPHLYAPRRLTRPFSVEALPLFWEAQTQALAIPHTGMAITTDLAPDPADIHPTNKRDIGRRLAALALVGTYGRKDVESSGPVFRAMQVRGGEVELTFDHAAGLASRDDKTLSEFTVAGADRCFRSARAELRAGKVVVSAPEVAKPVAVRLGWRETANSNLVNAAGLPARSFRTDDWPVDRFRAATADDVAMPALPAVARPAIPTLAVRLTDFGAVADGQTLNTAAFAAAIDAVTAKGGGRVIVPAGLWRTGPVVLRSRLELHLERGAVLQFSDNRADYPLVETIYEGRSQWRCQSPISGRKLEHVAITGDGVVDGAGQVWRPVKKSKFTGEQWTALVKSGGVVNPRGDIWYPSPGALAGNEGPGARAAAEAGGAAAIKDALRPVLVSLIECRFVLLEGVTFQNSPAWCLHPLLCENLTVRRVNVRNPWFAQNGDGLDLESCRNVLVEQSTFDVGDDAICLKSGRDAEGRRRGKPTENVTVRDCTVYHGHGGFVVGSEMSGGVSNIRVSDCTFLGTDVGLRFKSTRGRGGVVENILVERIRMTNIPTEAILFDLFYGGKGPTEDGAEGAGASAASVAVPAVSEETPAFRNIVLRDIVCRGARRAALLRGLPEMPLENIRLENLDLIATEGVVLAEAANLRLQGVRVRAAQGPALTMRDARGVAVQGLVVAANGAPTVTVSGARSVAISLPEFSAAAVTVAPEVPRTAVQWKDQ